MSWPKSLADDLMLLAEHARDLDPSETISESDVRPSMTVRAPCCGRVCAADMVTDVRDVPGIDRDWMCDGCEWSFLREENGWSKSRYVRAIGAPPEDVRVHWVRERVLSSKRRAVELRDNEPFAPEEARQRAIRHLPPEGEYPPGTEPPPQQ